MRPPARERGARGLNRPATRQIAGSCPQGRGAQDAAGRVTHRRVLRIALPILLSNVTVPILGAVDTAVVGQMGQAAPIGAVGLGAVVLASVYWIFGFLRMGTTGLAAQAAGAGAGMEAAAILARALLTGFAAGAAIILLQAPMLRAAFAIAPAGGEVEALARAYLGLRVWGAPATIALYAVTGWLIAVERTRAVLLLQLWVNGLNALLDLWFVLGLGWGVEGVAAATLAAEWTGLGLGLWLCRARLAAFLRARAPGLLEPAGLGRMMRVNADILLRSVALQGAFTAFVFLGAGLGDVTLAANQLLFQFLAIIAHALDGFAFAAEALVGQAFGARALPALRRGALLASLWGLGAALLLSAAFWAAGPAAIALMATDPAVQAAARAHLGWIVLLPVLSLPAYMLDGIFIGATATRAMRNSMLVSVAVYAAVLAAALPPLGNDGLWLALAVLNLVRMATLLAAYPGIERALAPAAARPA